MTVWETALGQDLVKMFIASMRKQRKQYIRTSTALNLAPTLKEELEKGSIVVQTIPRGNEYVIIFEEQ